MLMRGKSLTSLTYRHAASPILTRSPTAKRRSETGWTNQNL